MATPIHRTGRHLLTHQTRLVTIASCTTHALALSSILTASRLNCTTDQLAVVRRPRGPQRRPGARRPRLPRRHTRNDLPGLHIQPHVSGRAGAHTVSATALVLDWYTFGERKRWCWAVGISTTAEGRTSCSRSCVVCTPQRRCHAPTWRTCPSPCTLGHGPNWYLYHRAGIGGPDTAPLCVPPVAWSRTA